MSKQEKTVASIISRRFLNSPSSNLIGLIIFCAGTVGYVPRVHSDAPVKEPYGGVVVDCSGKIALLDLFEGGSRFGRIIPEDHSTPADQQVEQALAKLERYKDVQMDARLEWARLRTYLTEIPSSLMLIPLGDGTPLYIPAGCELLQAMTTSPEGPVLLSSKIWSRMNPTHQAALILHEIFYAMNRAFTHGTNSNPVRKAVSYLMATNTTDEEFFAEVVESLAGAGLISAYLGKASSKPVYADFVPGEEIQVRLSVPKSTGQGKCEIMEGTYEGPIVGTIRFNTLRKAGTFAFTFPKPTSHWRKLEFKVGCMSANRAKGLLELVQGDHTISSDTIPLSRPPTEGLGPYGARKRYIFLSR